MTDQEILCKLIEIPNEEETTKTLKNVKNSEINDALGRSLIYINKQINLLKSGIVDLEQSSQSNSDNIKLSQFYIEEKIVLEQKLEEKSALKALIRNRYEMSNSTITIDQYNKERDNLLRIIIFNRAKLYRSKEWLKYWCVSKNINLDSQWLSQFGITMNENKRDTEKIQKSYKFYESKEIYEILKNQMDKNIEILLFSDEIKEFLVLRLIVPDYIANKLSSLYLKNKIEDVELKTR